MTGVEMAGIALAVVPLCLYVLEHHEAELRPWKALIKYRVQYRRSVDDLGICLVDLEITIRNVFIDAELADDDQDFNTLVHAYNPKHDADHKAKLVAYFGRSAYEHGFETKLRQIQDSVNKISSVLGLEDLSSQTHDHGIWARVEEVKHQRCAYDSSAATSQTKKILKSRAKFILGSMTIDKHLKKLSDDIRWLANTAEKAGKRSKAKCGSLEWGPKPSRHQNATFVPPLHEIVLYAQRLYNALQRVWLCPQHDIHHVSLRLDQRLKSRNTSGSSQTRDVASFTLAFAPTTDANAWESIEVCVSKSIPSPAPNKSTKGVKFAVPSGNLSMESSNPQERSIQNLCSTQGQAQTVEKRVYLNESDEIVQRGPSSQSPSCQGQARRRVSFKTLLHQPRDPKVIYPLLTTEQAISLGSVVVSSFLQLDATRWLAESWCSENLYFLKSNDFVDIRETYVSMSHNSANTTHARDTQTTQNDGLFFMKLGTILLEIWTQTAIEHLRSQHHAISNPSIPVSQSQDLAVIVDNVKRLGGIMQPCFLNAINYCMGAFVTGVPDARDPDTRVKIIKYVLFPFESELQNWQPAAQAI